MAKSVKSVKSVSSLPPKCRCCKFKKGADIVEVVPNLGVDISKAIDSGVIKDTSATVFHNMMSELGEIGHVARDPFDIIEYERSYTKFRKYVNDTEKKKIDK